MAFELPASKGPVRDLANEAGHTLGFALQAIGALVVATFRRRLSIAETLNQTVFIGRVSTGPSLLLMFRSACSSRSPSVNSPDVSEPVATPARWSPSSSSGRPRHWCAR